MITAPITEEIFKHLLNGFGPRKLSIKFNTQGFIMINSLDDLFIRI